MQAMVGSMILFVRRRDSRVDLAVILNQAAVIDHHALLLQQIERAGGTTRFIWPNPGGPLQGVMDSATRRLQRLGVKLDVVEMSAADLMLEYEQGRLGALMPQTPYLDDSYAPEYQEALATIPLVYMNYGLHVFAQPHYMSNPALFSRFRFLLAESSYHYDELVNAGIPADQVLQVGHPSAYWLRRQWTRKFRLRASVLWAPHWTREFSTWEDTLPTVLAIARARPRVRIRLSPHPLLERLTGLALPEGYDKAKQTKESSGQLLLELENQENIVISRDSMLRDIVETDMCITDGIAPIGFFGLTGKPLAVTTSSQRLAAYAPNYSESLKYVFESGSQSEIFDWALKQLDAGVVGRVSRAQVQAAYGAVSSYDKSPGSLLLKHLRSVL